MDQPFNTLNRRQFMGRTGATILGTTALASGLMATAARAQDFAATSGEPVYFRGWQFRTDVVQGNVDRYNSTHGGMVDYATVTGDYPQLMEQAMIANNPLDVLYANPSSAVRYAGGGWVMPAADLPNIDEITEAMYPNIREAWSHDGKLLGLSYFVSVRGTLLVNLKGYEAGGLDPAVLPRTWDELYEAIYKLAEAGHATPFLPHWFSEWFGISWGFAFEVMNRGGQVADPETHQPMMTVDGPAGATLTAWKQLWKSGLVPEEVLSYNEAGYIDAYRSGRYVFSPQQVYDIKTFNDPAQSGDVAGDISLLPGTEQSWGLIDLAMYLMTNRNRSEALTEDVKKFTSWYGFKDETGEFAVANRWLVENMLFSAYRPVMESDLARDSITSSLARPEDYETVLEVYSKTPYPKGIWNVVWSEEEFNSWLREKLFAFLQDDLSVESVIEEANAQIDMLNGRYGI